MPILSLEFVCFFMLFFPAYWLCQPTPKIQNALLLVASIALLAYLDIRFAVSVGVFSVFIYCVSWGISLKQFEFLRVACLTLGIGAAISLLAFFKYVDFFRDTLYQLGIGELAEVVMPLGLSYYIFQSIAYLMSLYREKITLPRFDELLLHFSFFLTITSGPIIRADNFKSIRGEQVGLFEQIRQSRELRYAALAITLILLGLAKKWWFAGQINEYWVTPIFDNPLQYSSLAILGAIYSYTLQLFFDFSGYCDLVIGLGLLLGFRLPMNFDAPLYAANIRDFWSRWHISLTTWIRDYIYIPLGGSRQSFFRNQINLLIAFALSGIWHGNTWNFLIWGLLHGLALMLLNIKQYLFNSPTSDNVWSCGIKKYLSILLTFHFVCLSFVVFKLNTLDEVRNFFYALFSTQASNAPANYLQFCIIFVGLFCYPLWISLFEHFVSLLKSLPIPYWVIIVLLVLQVIIYFSPAGIPGFIYAGF